MAMTESAPRTRPDVDRILDQDRVTSSRTGWIGLAVLLLVGGAFLYHETRGTTWWFDEWTWALYSRGGGSLSTYLAAHAGHLSLIPIAIYKALFATAGLRDYAPYRIVLILGQLTLVALVFVYARRRVEQFLALLAAALLLFFGPGWQDILWPFQIAWLISIACGVGALLLFDRDDLAGTIGACVLLTISITSTSIGVAITAGAAVDIALSRRGWRQLWVIVVPLTVYALWSIGHQHSTVTGQALSGAADFAATTAAATMAALFGLGSPIQHGLNVDSGTLLQWGPPLAVALVAVLVWRLVQLRRVPSRVLTLLTIVCSFWLLIGIDRQGGSQAFESRYLYAGAVFVILLAVELLPGVRLTWIARAVIGVVALAVLVTNIGVLRNDATFLRQQAQLTRAEVGAFDITRGVVAPDFATGPLNSIAAGPYFETQKALGSPASTPAEIASDPEAIREQIDAELANIHQINLKPSSGAIAPGSPPTLEGTTGGSVRRAGGCQIFLPATFVGATNPPAILNVRLPASGLRISTEGGEATIGYRRFADAFQGLGVLKPGPAVALRIGADLSPQPWHLQIVPTGRTTLCTL